MKIKNIIPVTGPVITPETVSYTHLDVYKRQLTRGRSTIGYSADNIHNCFTVDHFSPPVSATLTNLDTP